MGTYRNQNNAGVALLTATVFVAVATLVLAVLSIRAVNQSHQVDQYINFTDTFQGVTSKLEDNDNDPRRLNYPVRNLHPGWHTIGFKASDKGGKWSPGTNIDILVINSNGDNVIFLPLLVP